MNILAIGAHPDDIEFGCGGTLMKYVEKGANVYLLILTKGDVGGNPVIRKKEQEKAGKFIKAKKIYWGNFKDTLLPLNKPLISTIEEVINKVKPQLVLGHYLEDIHQDHRALSSACISATRYIKEVLCYEVPTSKNFNPNIFVNIEDVFNRKLELLKIHASQVHKTNVENLTILDSVQACAVFRGYQGRVKHAEGFISIRMIKDI
jgi:LmbE family N-acetylglucosaminyl deacetylase